MTTLLTADDVRARLREAIGEAGSQVAWARAHDTGDGYVRDVLSGRREPGKPILKALGLEDAGRFYAPVGTWHPEDLYDDAAMSREDSL
jgi:hypothetical protein